MRRIAIRDAKLTEQTFYTPGVVPPCVPSPLYGFESCATECRAQSGLTAESFDGCGKRTHGFWREQYGILSVAEHLADVRLGWSDHGFSEGEVFE